MLLGDRSTPRSDDKQHRDRNALDKRRRGHDGPHEQSCGRPKGAGSNADVADAEHRRDDESRDSGFGVRDSIGLRDSTGIWDSNPESRIPNPVRHLLTNDARAGEPIVETAAIAAEHGGEKAEPGGNRAEQPQQRAQQGPAGAHAAVVPAPKHAEGGGPLAYRPPS